MRGWSGLSRWQSWVRRLKADVMTLWFARRDPATPWWVRTLLVVVLAYALSPIDLIPDAIPVLGLLDDLVLLPLLIALALRGIPPAALDRARTEAETWLARRETRPRSLGGAVAIALIWAAAVVALVAWWR